MTAPPVRLRFAPSPNGRLHLGHAYSALLNEHVARELGGTWLLRIEDIDPVRATAGNVEAIAADLAWLGLSWPQPVRRQSRHLDAYHAAADRLREAGLLYPCFCSRGAVAAACAVQEAGTGMATPRDPDGAPIYPGTCRALGPDTAAARIAAGDPHAWRLAMDRAVARLGPVEWRRFDRAGREEAVAARPERWGDVVMVRRDVAASYHLCVVHDDAAQGITHVVRGSDLMAATDLHAVLAGLFGYATPVYHHHELLTDPSGAKLSKSRNSLSLEAMRASGVTAIEIRARLGF